MLNGLTKHLAFLRQQMVSDKEVSYHQSLYIDELSGRLSTSNVGCFIDGTCMNHFFYADDICLLAPSAISLQELINICAT